MANKNILLSAVTLNDFSIGLKFYDPINDKILIWSDNKTYKPYCYILSGKKDEIEGLDGVEGMEEVVLNNIVKDYQVKMIKVIARDNGVISKISELQPTWNTNILNFQNYLYDNNFVIGQWYEFSDDVIYDDHKVIGDPPKVVESEVDIDLSNISRESVVDVKKFDETLKTWAKLLSEEIPKIKRLAFDIEVQSSKNAMPDPLKAENTITAVGFVGDDIKQVFVLNRDDVPMGELDPDTNYKFFDSEIEMLEESFKIIERYAMVLTFNGDTFDMPYMYNRATRLGIEKTPFKMMKRNATLNNGVHIDLYPVFKNRSLKGYAFNSKYVDNSLNAVSEALLGERKTEYDGELNEIPLGLLGKYCQNDSRLTHKLTTYNGDLVMNLLIILSKIANMPIDELSRRPISTWIRSMFYYKHKQNGDLIPRSTDFPDVESSTKAVIKDKKYQGAIVQEPKKGIHFKVVVTDFASLYPSIIKTRNISYESVNCPHNECKSNIIPFTTHWSCTKKSGIASILIGSLKELRVDHFKQLLREAKKKNNKDDMEKYDMIVQALKVYLNASYGVIGAESFELYYLPTAESVTAVGRDIITKTANYAKSFGMDVVYGDTDSLFFKNPTDDQIQKVIKYTTVNYAIDLEVDKEYKYCVLSDRKKNYFGIKMDGTVDIKGLTGKKSNTPPFLKTLFSKILDELKTIEMMEQFEPIKNKIKKMIKTQIDDFDKLKLEDLVFTVQINQEINSYKSKPQALIAAEQLSTPPQMGQYVKFIKTWNEPHAKPVEMTKYSDIDRPKYFEAIEKTLEQVTDPMDIDFDLLFGKGKATTISDFF